MYHPLYMVVDKDDIPCAVAESAWELARMLGVDVTSILHAVGRREKKPRKKSKYKLVWVSDSDEE